jgi:hypothetical protein
MAPRDIPRRGLSPLWIVALFLSFSETVLGIAVIKTSGNIQLSLTVFVITFPAIVCGLFFLILWKKPQVFYTPKEFSNEGGVKAFVEAMTMTRHTSQGLPVSEAVFKGIEAKITSLSEAISRISDPKQQTALILKETKEAVKESVVQINSHSIFPTDGRIWEEAFDPQMPMSEFLDNLYFALSPWGLPAHTYGKIWAIRNIETKEIIIPAGRTWARVNGLNEDSRSHDNGC